MTPRLVRALAVVILLVVSFSLTFGCGPFTMEAVFVFTVHPAYPLSDYARGQIGVIQPSYARSYLYVAYRYLNNAPFTAEEQKALTQLWDERLNNTMALGEEDWVKAWLDARQKVAGLPASPKIDVFRSREKPNEYETYLNCPKDSFDTAVSRLNEQIKKFGADSQAVKTWIEGQDQVFANCSEGQHIPAALSAGADRSEQADRTYQVAAANFYAGKFDEAQQGFSSIASDASSPWKNVAPYLLARVFLRKASLGAEETKKQSLTAAETQLKTVLDDKKLAGVHGAAARLLDLVRLRLHPAERRKELAHTLVSKGANSHLKQDLWDYTVLLDGPLESDGPAKDATAKEELSSDDLSDWIATLQGSFDLEHAAARWEAQHSAAWLVAVLSKLDGKNPRVAEFIREALNVKPTSAAFATARFHAVRLQMDSGKSAEARTLLDQLLKSNRAQFDPSSLNLLTSKRMMLATSLADFLAHAPRVPAALSWNDDGREAPAEAGEVAEANKALIGKPLFDVDAAWALNSQMPLTVLKEAAMSPSLPTNLRRDLAQAVWVRAVLLNDFTTADELVPTLKTLVPGLTSVLDGYAKATPENKKFSALYGWLKSPGIEPVVDIGIGRDTPLSDQDSYRDNWWCGASIEEGSESAFAENTEITSFTADTKRIPEFLTATQRTAGAREWTNLRALGVMPNYLCKQMIQWATKDPDDPRLPEALHLAVNATRYGCGDKDTGRWSKAAFDLLHRKYPNTTWAKKTKYWFKE